MRCRNNAVMMPYFFEGSLSVKKKLLWHAKKCRNNAVRHLRHCNFNKDIASNYLIIKKLNAIILRHCKSCKTLTVRELVTAL